MPVQNLFHASGLSYGVNFHVADPPLRAINIGILPVRVTIFFGDCFWKRCP